MQERLGSQGHMLWSPLSPQTVKAPTVLSAFLGNPESQTMIIYELLLTFFDQMSDSTQQPQPHPSPNSGPWGILVRILEPAGLDIWTEFT